MGYEHAAKHIQEMLEHLDVVIRELDEKTVAVRIGNILGSRANVATDMAKLFATHEGLLIESSDPDTDTAWERLIRGAEVTVRAVPSWHWAEYADLGESLTSVELSKATGMKINTVRSQLGLWHRGKRITPLPEYVRYGARLWPRAGVIKAIRCMPTKGNWGSGQGRARRDVTPTV